jgi:hypothetical protein
VPQKVLQSKIEATITDNNLTKEAVHMLERILVLVVLSIFPVYSGLALWDSARCDKLVDQYEKRHGQHITPTNISDAFIFFMHIPRTAGKTYDQCFLRAAVPPTKRCASSYDLLRLNVSQDSCRYLVSHNDYSITAVSIHSCTCV